MLIQRQILKVQIRETDFYHVYYTLYVQEVMGGDWLVSTVTTTRRSHLHALMTVLFFQGDWDTEKIEWQLSQEDGELLSVILSFPKEYALWGEAHAILKGTGAMAAKQYLIEKAPIYKLKQKLKANGQ